jgi:hypothetical protein
LERVETATAEEVQLTDLPPPRRPPKGQFFIEKLKLNLSAAQPQKERYFNSQRIKGAQNLSTFEFKARKVCAGPGSSTGPCVRPRSTELFSLRCFFGTPRLALSAVRNLATVSPSGTGKVSSAAGLPAAGGVLDLQ